MTRDTFEARLLKIRSMADTALGDFRLLDPLSATPRERALLRRQTLAVESAITDLEMEANAFIYFTTTAQNKLDFAPIPRIDIQTSLLHFKEPVK